MQNCFGAPQLFIEWVLGIIKSVGTHDFLPTDKDQFFIRLQAEYFIRASAAGVCPASWFYDTGVYSL